MRVCRGRPLLLRMDISFHIHSVLSTNVDRKKGCFDPFPLALLLSDLICHTLYHSVLLCSILSKSVLFSSVPFCYILFCSFLFCLVTSCLVLYHAVLTRIALFLCFTVPCSMPFYAMRHCDVTLCYSAQCTMHPLLISTFTLFRSLILL